MNAGSRAQAAAGEGRQLAERAQDSRGYRLLVTLGLVCFGLVHLIVGGLAVGVAAGVGGAETDQQGALRSISAQPFGGVLLIVVAVGFFALVVWQLFEAAVGFTWLDGGKRTRKRLSALARSIVYAGLGASAVRFAVGSGGGGGQGEQTASATLLSLPFGQVLLVVLGLVVVGIGGYQAYKGIAGRYEDDLSGHLTGASRVVAVVGHVAKGLAYVIVGGLFIVAAVTADPEAAGGLDAALRTLSDQPFGQVLLGLMALGLACYGIYCFVWSRRARHS